MPILVGSIGKGVNILIIVKRHKNIRDEVIGYTLYDGKDYSFISKENAIRLRDRITNAHLNSKLEYIANTGERIVTVKDSELLTNASNLSKKLSIQKSNFNEVNNYYGGNFINICKRIRYYAYSGRLCVDTRRHRSNDGRNIHLFKLIEACGFSVEEFVSNYLKTLQPYSLTKFQGSRTKSNYDIWLSDIGYGVSLVIKISEKSKERPVVVSFHESNRYGYQTRGGKDFSDKLCAVLIHGDVAKVNDNLYNVTYLIQRGFLLYPVSSTTPYIGNGVALVDYKDIKLRFDTVIHEIINGIFLSYSDGSSQDLFSSVGSKGYNNLTFMSIGYNEVSNICLLIDLYSQYTDKKNRSILVTLTTNLLSCLSDYELVEIKAALKLKYDGSSNKLYKAIVDEGGDV